jgi:hypothetical protein
MLVRIPEESVLAFFKMLDSAIKETGTLYISCGRVSVKGDKDKGVMPLGYFYQDVEFPPMLLTHADIEGIKKTYIDCLFSKHRLTDLIIFYFRYEGSDRFKFDFVFGSNSYEVG